jgi:hypothetical protein
MVFLQRNTKTQYSILRFESPEFVASPSGKQTRRAGESTIESTIESSMISPNGQGPRGVPSLATSKKLLV